jgi:hypothetical protein
MAGRPDATGPEGQVQADASPANEDQREASSPRGGSGSGPVRYEFLVAGRLSDAVLASFPELRSSAGPAGGTALYGLVEDAAHLHGLLSRFQTLGISIAEMRQLPD